MTRYATRAEARTAQEARVGAATVARVLAYAHEVATSSAHTLEAPPDLYDALEAALSCWPIPAAVDAQGRSVAWSLGDYRFCTSDPHDHLLLQGKRIYRLDGHVP